MSKKHPYVHSECDYLHLCLPMIPLKILRFDLQLCHISRPAQFMVNYHKLSHTFLQHYPLYLHHQVCSHTQYFLITHLYQYQLQGATCQHHLYQRMNFEAGCSNDIISCIAFLSTYLRYYFIILLCHYRIWKLRTVLLIHYVCHCSSTLAYHYSIGYMVQVSALIC